MKYTAYSQDIPAECKVTIGDSECGNHLKLFFSVGRRWQLQIDFHRDMHCWTGVGTMNLERFSLNCV